MSSSTVASNSEQGQVIPIDQLGIEQLSSLQKQLDQELNFFGESLGELKGVEAKFAESAAAVAELDVDEGKAALVPLSESMYVMAKLVEPDKVLVEIGTGYFVEMSRAKAKDYFERKQKYLQVQMTTIEKILPDKQRTRAVIVDALQTKIQSVYRSQASSATTKTSSS